MASFCFKNNWSQNKKIKHYPGRRKVRKYLLLYTENLLIKIVSIPSLVFLHRRIFLIRNAFRSNDTAIIRL